MEGHRPRRHGGRLFWRVYLHGLVLLALVGVAVALVVAALGPGPAARSPDLLVSYAAARAAEIREDPVRLTGELRRVHEALGAKVSIYRDDGPLLATGVDPPLPPLDPGDRSRLAGGPIRIRGRGPIWAARLPGESAPAYLVVAVPLHGHATSRFTAVVGAVLLALAIGSIPLARGISAPLEKLTRTARAFGGGDLSARSRLRRRGEVGELSVAFDEMADRIERLLRNERELLANVSHELRTPLARIRVALELASEGDVERARRALDEIAADLAELERLVDDVLAASRLDLATGGPDLPLPLRRAPADVRELLETIATRFREAHPGRRLEVESDEALPVIDADAALLRRALENLLDNARKYSDAEPISLSAHRSEGALAIEVRDRGIGIDPADMPRLFEPFFRSDRSRARGTGGVGLGLALARRIVEAHGGRITVESRPGAGTAVRFTIPTA